MMRKIFFSFFIIFVVGITTVPAQTHKSLESAEFPSLISGIRINPPIDFCGEPVPLDNQTILEGLEKELLLFTWDRAQIILWMKRMGRYMLYIEKTLKNNRMPDDLKYVAVVESALLPHIGSSKRAIGYWQFIRSTGLRYGLTINSDIDERRNIFKSTDAAVGYFRKLYGDFGSWTLAAAAYNMGEYGLKSNIEFQKTYDFYNLYLPMETQRYILRIVAAKLILSAPEKYGFHLKEEDFYSPREFDHVDVECVNNTPIQLIAEAAGTYYKTIKELNPELRGRNMSGGKHSIAIPKGSAGTFRARFQKLYTEWSSDNKKNIRKKKARKRNRIYVVKKGDSLSRIATKFRVPLSKLLRWNKLSMKKPIHPGKRLIIKK